MLLTRYIYKPKHENLQKLINAYELKGACNDEEDELVTRLAAMSPNTADDTSAGLRSSLREVHGDSHEGAESLKWTQRTRYNVIIASFEHE